MFKKIFTKLGFIEEDADYKVEYNSMFTDAVNSLIRGKENFSVTVFNTMEGCSNICFVNFYALFGRVDFSNHGVQVPKDVSRENVINPKLFPLSIIEDSIFTIVFAILNLIGYYRNIHRKIFGIYLNGSIDKYIKEYLADSNKSEDLLWRIKLWIILHEVGHLHNKKFILLGAIEDLITKIISFGMHILLILIISSFISFLWDNTLIKQLPVFSLYLILLCLVKITLNLLSFKIGEHDEIAADKYAFNCMPADIACLTMEFFHSLSPDNHKPSLLDKFLGLADPHPLPLERKQIMLSYQTR